MAEQFTPTVTPEATGSASTAGAVIEGQQEVNKWKNVFAVGQGAAKLAGMFAEEEVRNQLAYEKAQAEAEANAKSDMDKELKLQGYAAGSEFVINTSDEDVIISSQKTKDLINKTVMNDEDMPYAYRKGLLEAVNSANRSRGIEAEKIVREKDTIYSSNALAIKHFGSVDTDSIKRDIQEEATRKGTDKALVRDAYLSSHYSMIVNQLSSINDIDSLNEFTGAIDEMEVELRKDPQLFGSKSTGNISQVLSTGRSAYTDAVSAAKTRIFTKLDAERAEADGIFNLLPYEYNQNLINRYGKADNKEYIVKSAEYAKNYETHTINRGVKQRYSPEASMSMQDNTRVFADAALKKELTDITTNSLNTWFDSNSTVDAIRGIRTIAVNPALSKEFGSGILSQYNGAASEEELAHFYNRFDMWRSSSNGPNALNTAMGYQEYNTVLLTGLMKDMGYAQSYTQARENIQIARNSPELMKVKFREENSHDYAKELGTRKDTFFNMSRVLMARGISEKDATQAVYKRMIEGDKEFSSGVTTIEHASVEAVRGVNPIVNTLLNIKNTVTGENAEGLLLAHPLGSTILEMRKKTASEKVPSIKVSGLPPMEYGNEENVHEMLGIRIKELLGPDIDLDTVKLEGVPGGKGRMFIRVGEFNTAVATIDMNEIVEDANEPEKLAQWRKDHVVRTAVLDMARDFSDKAGKAFSLDRTEARKQLTRRLMQTAHGRKASAGEIQKWVDSVDQEIFDILTPSKGE